MLIPFDYLFTKYDIKPLGVLHLGANTGQEGKAYAQFGITNVIWVEALPEIYRHLQREVQQWPGNLALLACVAEVDGRIVKFNVASNGGQSSSFLEFGTHRFEHPTVKFVRQIEMPTVRVDSLLRRNGLAVGPHWFLNIDLQGAELHALKGMGDLLWKFDHAYIEVNVKELYRGCALVDEVDEYLLKFGLVGQETKMTGAGWGDKYYRRIQPVLC